MLNPLRHIHFSEAYPEGDGSTHEHIVMVAFSRRSRVLSLVVLLVHGHLIKAGIPPFNIELISDAFLKIGDESRLRGCIGMESPPLRFSLLNLLSTLLSRVQVVVESGNGVKDVFIIVLDVIIQRPGLLMEE